MTERAALRLALLLAVALLLPGCAASRRTVEALPPAAQPQWKPGDWWSFSARTRSPFAMAQRMEVRSVGEEIVLIGDGEAAKSATLNKDLSVRSVSGPMLSYSVNSGTDAYVFFPMAVGQTRIFTQNTTTAKGSATYTNTVTVEAAEEITVPAGVFKAFRIKVTKKSDTGWSGVYTLWYAPEAAFFVRVVDVRGNNAVLEQYGRK